MYEIKDLKRKLLSGDHIFIREYEIFMSYTGTIWTRRKMTKEEINLEGFEGIHQEPFDSIEEMLESISIDFNKQLTLF